MIKPIGPQYVAAKQNQRVGLTHASNVINRLMRIYGLEEELQDQQEFKAAEMQTREFHATSLQSEPVVIAPALAELATTQSTFSWFD